MPVVIVKLGSSIVAEDSGALRLSVVARVCEEVARLHEQGTDVVVVTSGAIARGMHLLALPSRPRGIDQLQAASAMGQGRLYRTYDELLSELGVQTAQVLLTFFDMSARTHYLNARRTLQALLEWRIVPVINENDTTTTDEISFGDNDFLAAQVAVLLQADLLVLLTDTAGVFTANPRTDPRAELIAEIADFETLAAEVGHHVSVLGSGGMRSKVVAAEMATAAGIETVIGSGLEPGTVLRAAARQPAGTRCLPRPLGMSSFKLWLRYAKAARGRILVDAGAARALRDGGTSLLPVGITAVEGEFDPGDAVDVLAAEDRSAIGKGLVNYTTGELRQIMGLKTAQVQELMPRATQEAVHREHFVLEKPRVTLPGMVVATPTVTEQALAAKGAARTLAQVSSAVKDAALEAIADAVIAGTDEILAANALDLDAGRAAGLPSHLLDRLALDPARIAAMAAGARDIAALPDPVGEVLDGKRLPNGLSLRRVRVPLGVVAVVYEARPNVTVDAAALALKSGNAILLRGSSTAAHSNAVLARIAREAAIEAGLPAGALTLVAGGGREELAELATQTGVVDLIIPRGGEGLKAALSAVATVPVIYAASGNCHVYVDASADLDAARAIIINAKVQRPSVCNSAETLLVHAEAADAFLPDALAALRGAGVELRLDDRAAAIAGSPGDGAATEEDFATEFLDLVLAVGVVEGVDEAIEHVNRYGSGHSEAIVTSDVGASRAFQLGVDSACVYVNTSTRFTDGGEYGMGAEIGNSTQKLHARGPIGLRELCTYRYLVEGTGQVRP